MSKNKWWDCNATWFLVTICFRSKYLKSKKTIVGGLQPADGFQGGASGNKSPVLHLKWEED